MSDAAVETDEDIEEKKSSKLPMIIGIVLALAGGGVGFFAAHSGMIGGGGETENVATEGAAEESSVPTIELPDVQFVEVPQLTISLGPHANAQHLRFRASLEVPTQHAAEVEGILPRIQDVLNSYLRALEPSDIEAPGSLIRLRAQMLRRIKIVAGEGRVDDLLVLEFVLN